MSLPTIRRPAALIVSSSLREVRERRKVGLRRLADKLSVSPARLSGWELGTHVPHPPQVAHILGFLGISGAEYERLMNLAKHVHDDNFIATGEMQAFSLMWTYEQMADRVVEWAPFRLPDLLRLPQHFNREPGTDEKTACPELEPLERTVRQQAMLDGHRRYLFLIGEEAVHAASNEADADEQIRHLRGVASQHHVSIQIVPTTASELNPQHAFTLFEHRRTSMAVAFKNIHCIAYLTEKSLLDNYSATARTLERQAFRKAATVDALANFPSGRAS
ncbi:Scr1 family TA system antitoxin-like transcriptional regulator [Amycolatopsis lexingtonensis]|uniref:Scr1 family TA system antitoxin-like transcriptional regulator n=1 Tax=Amycolatopsis lexingtonensis TaxID=218822 RepID=UPI003F6E8E60